MSRNGHDGQYTLRRLDEEGDEQSDCIAKQPDQRFSGQPKYALSRVGGYNILSQMRALRERFPWLPLGSFPTRVVRAEGFPDTELWLKRDDESGPLYGGNKVRKLEYLLGEAQARGAKRLVTIGGYGSHHVLATGILGRAAGFEVEAVVFPQPITDHVRETVTAGAAAGIHYHASASYWDLLPRIVRQRWRRGSHWVAPGGSSPIGTMGYVSAGLELAGQVARSECPAPDVIYVALGSCGTAAGLWLGLQLAGLRCRVVAVRVVDRWVANRSATLRLGHATARLIDEPCALDPDLLTVDHRFFGGAYGRVTDAAGTAVERGRELGLVLETTYTGKAFAALLADVEAGRLAGKRALFWNTFSSVPLPRGTREGLPPRLARL